MSHLQTLHLSHLPPSLAIHVALYQDLNNASFLREQLLSGNTEFEYALIDASTILSTKHVLSAAFRAINDYANQRLKSKNVHSEIVFSLSPNNNVSELLYPIYKRVQAIDYMKIAESFRRFGITGTTKDLLVIKVSTSPDITHDAVAEHLNKVVDAKPIPFSEESLKAISDLGKVTKAYKLGSRTSAITQGRTPAASGSTVNDFEEEEDERRRLEMCIIGAIALRGAL